MTTQNITYQITENNGGGITLYVWENDNLIYGHSGFEQVEPQSLLDALEALANGSDTREWDGNDLYDVDLIASVRETFDEMERSVPGNAYDDDGNIIPLTHSEYYDSHESTKVIYSSQEGPADYNVMGNAGCNIFYPNGDPEDQ